MKILHTSDWHLGSAFAGKKRYDEFDQTLAWLINLVKTEAIRAIIIAGDVFDTPTPSNRAQTQYYRFLLEASQSGVRDLVVTAGNHDSASFLEAPAELLKQFRIHVIGKPPASPDDAIMELKNDSGLTEALLCAVPYLHDADLYHPMFGEDFQTQSDAISNAMTTFYSRVCHAAVLRRTSLPQGDTIPILATAHLFVSNSSTLDNTEVGMLRGFHAATFPESIDYLALGHLHVPQSVCGHPNFRYSGSLLPMSVSNTDLRPKQVVILNTAREEPAGQNSIIKFRPVEIPSFQRIEQIKCSYERITERIDILKTAEESIWLTVENTGEFVPHLHEKLLRILNGSKVELLSSRNKERNPAAIARSSSEETLQEITPQEVFRRILAQETLTPEHSRQLSEAFSGLVRDVLERDHKKE